MPNAGHRSALLVWAAGVDREQALTVGLPSLTAGVFLVAWQMVTKLWVIPAVLLPAPTDIFRQLEAVWPELLYQGSFTGAEVGCGV